MKVNGASLNKIVNLYGENKKHINSSSKIEKKDSLEISSLGKSLSSISNDDTYVNSKEKLEAIKNEISKGTYRSDSRLTAQKMIDIIKGKEV